MGQFCATESESKRCGRCVVVECDSACAGAPEHGCAVLASLRAAVERLGGSNGL